MAMKASRPLSNQTIRNLKRNIIDALFHRMNAGQTILYREQDIVALLNYLGQDPQIPGRLRGAWGDAICTLSSTKKAVHDIGVRGDKIKQYNKQAIMSSLVVFDENNAVKNMDFLMEVAPHKSKKGASVYIDKVVNIRREFDRGSISVLCDVQDKNHRDS